MYLLTALRYKERATFLDMFEVHTHKDIAVQRVQLKVFMLKARFGRWLQCRNPCMMDSHNAGFSVLLPLIILADCTTDSHRSPYGKTDSYIAGNPHDGQSKCR